MINNELNILLSWKYLKNNIEKDFVEKKVKIFYFV
jgi:hypothetical protein